MSTKAELEKELAALREQLKQAQQGSGTGILPQDCRCIVGPVIAPVTVSVRPVGPDRMERDGSVRQSRSAHTDMVYALCDGRVAAAWRVSRRQAQLLVSSGVASATPDEMESVREWLSSRVSVGG